MKNVKTLLLALVPVALLLSACSSKPTTNADRAKLEKAQRLADRHEARLQP